MVDMNPLGNRPAPHALRGAREAGVIVTPQPGMVSRATIGATAEDMPPAPARPAAAGMFALRFVLAYSAAIAVLVGCMFWLLD